MNSLPVEEISEKEISCKLLNIVSSSVSKQLQGLYKTDTAERQFKLASSPAICVIPHVLGEEDKEEIFTLSLKLTHTTPIVTFEEKESKPKAGGGEYHATPAIDVEKIHTNINSVSFVVEQ